MIGLYEVPRLNLCSCAETQLVIIRGEERARGFLPVQEIYFATILVIVKSQVKNVGVY